MQELYDSPSLDISYDSETRVLLADWRGYHSFDSGVAGCERVVEAVRKHGAEKVLNDNTRVRGLWVGMAEYCAQIWLPRLHEAGMRRFAWVYSPAPLSRISANAVLAAIDPDAFGIEVFYAREDALVWLLDER